MTPERWQQVKDALQGALERSNAERPAFLLELGASDPELLAEVESLLAADAAADEGFLDTPAASRAETLQEVANPLLGRRLGAYRITERVGSGGMGEVYKAVRADDEYHSVVAIKLVHSGGVPSYIAERLRAERQILAGLQHPNIAKLLDGGTTAEGTAYLVMELVDGVPITQYCDEHNLDGNARLLLFLEVCAAVQHAHQSMVIHRDLKPSNILVTPAGAPKLLDFGIAKILEPGAAGSRTEAPLTTLRILTPEYASPEQLRGVPVTAASDVYSLGVLLYELLTGTRPYSITERNLHDPSSSPYDSEPRRPSTVVRLGRRAGHVPARYLRGDLDKITLMALRLEPSRRYATVDQLAQDIRRHINHVPVLARKPTFSYKVSRFVARHTFGVIATGLLIAALVLGVFATMREARIADAHRARAERHFAEIRKLTSTLIFDLHDKLEDLPGAARSRRVLINTALQYLDALQRDAADDPTLQMDMAAAYLRLGDIQGTLIASEGDYPGARDSYNHALDLVRAALKAQPDSLQTRRQLSVLYNRISDVMWIMGDGRQSISAAQRALMLEEQVDTENSAPDTAYWISLYKVDLAYKQFRVQGASHEAAHQLRDVVVGLETMWRARPGDPRLRRLLCVTYYRTGEILLHEGYYADALELNYKARQMLEGVVGTGPADTDILVTEAAAQHFSAEALMNLGRLEEAAGLEQTVLGTVRSLVAADPKQAEFHGFVGMALAALADIAVRSGDPARAVQLLEEALRESETALSMGTLHPYIRNSKGHAQSLLGKAYAMIASDPSHDPKRQRQDWQTARHWYGLAATSFRDVTPVWAQAAGDNQHAEEEMARCDRMLAKRARGTS